jgi:hypothetical protein
MMFQFERVLELLGAQKLHVQAGLLLQACFCPLNGPLNSSFNTVKIVVNIVLFLALLLSVGMTIN